MSLIIKGKDFGFHMYTTKWQKRGLSLAHILVWLKETLHVHIVDDFICAEILDPEKDPVFFGIVTAQQVHGPCGSLNSRSPCMKDETCTKRYLPSFLKETQTGKDGYPLYRRKTTQERGFTATVSFRGSEIPVDCSILSSFNYNFQCTYQRRILQLCQINQVRMLSM